jgi:signal peptidase II
MESPQPTVKSNKYTLGTLLNFFNNHWLDYLILILFGGTLISLDQWTKALVRLNVPLGTDWLPSGLTWLLPYARVRHWYNSGAAFGIFQNGNMVFTILAIIVVILILYYFPRTQRNDWWLRVAMTLQFAGAAGNLIDRLYFKQVTDFISVGNFAIFNLADASISTGVVVLLIGVWLKEREEKKHAAWPPLSSGQSESSSGKNVDDPEENEVKGG